MHLSTPGRNSRPPFLVLYLVTALAAFAANGPVVAGEPDSEVIATTSGTRYSRSAPGGWRGATRSEDGHDKMPVSKALLTIRIYEGLETFRPYLGDEPAYGVDVTATIEQCPDGDDRISALTIGGRLYEVDGDCSNSVRRAGPPVSSAAAPADSAGAEDQVMRCDPATWRCRTVDR